MVNHAFKELLKTTVWRYYNVDYYHHHDIVIIIIIIYAILRRYGGKSRHSEKITVFTVLVNPWFSYNPWNDCQKLTSLITSVVRKLKRPRYQIWWISLHSGLDKWVKITWRFANFFYHASACTARYCFSISVCMSVRHVMHNTVSIRHCLSKCISSIFFHRQIRPTTSFWNRSVRHNIPRRTVSIPMTLSDLKRRDAKAQIFRLISARMIVTVSPRTTKLGMVTYTWGVFSGVNHALHSKGAVPILETPYIRPNLVTCKGGATCF